MLESFDYMSLPADCVGGRSAGPKFFLTINVRSGNFGMYIYRWMIEMLWKIDLLSSGVQSVRARFLVTRCGNRYSHSTFQEPRTLRSGERMV